jgi:HAD superfamily phosphoserine phosphatase-like hydrolase
MPPPALHVFCDFDGTITESDTLDCLTTRVGAGAEWYRETGRLILEGKLSLRDGIARDMETVRVPLADALAVVRRHVALDPGFPRFAAWCRAHGVPLTVLSGGLHEIIETYLPPADFPHVEVRANRLEPGSWRCVFRDATEEGHDKATAVREARAAGARTIFIGDGLSDRGPARIAHEVFARRGRYLVEFCREQGIGFREFDGFDDVLANLNGHHARIG